MSLRVNFTWTLVAQIIYAACQWAQLSFLARNGTPLMVGQFSLALAVTAPIIMLLNLNLRAVQVTDVEERYCFGQYFGLRTVTSATALLIVSVVANRYSSDTKNTIIAVGIAKIIESISDIYYGLFQKSERMDIVAKSMVMRGLIALLALITFSLIGNGVAWAAIGLASGWALVLITYDIPQSIRLIGADRVHQLKPRWDPEAIKEIAIKALPLGLVMGLISLNANIPRYVVESNLGEYQLGILSPMLYLVTLGNMVVTALGQSASPRLAKLFAEGRKVDFKKLVKILLTAAGMLGVGSVILAMAVGPWVLNVLFGPEYADNNRVFIQSMLGGAVGYIASVFGYGMTAARLFRAQVPLFLLVVIATTTSAMYLVPRFGLSGGPLSILTGSIVQACGASVLLWHALRKTETCGGIAQRQAPD